MLGLDLEIFAVLLATVRSFFGAVVFFFGLVLASIAFEVDFLVATFLLLVLIVDFLVELDTFLGGGIGFNPSRW